MPRTYRNQVFVNGALQSEDVVSLPDSLFVTDDARARLRALKIAATLDQWATDARAARDAEQAASDGWSGFTAAQKDTANKATHTRLAVTFDRLATFFDRFSDVLVGIDP